jgi:hypothetical protein
MIDIKDGGREDGESIEQRPGRDIILESKQIAFSSLGTGLTNSLSKPASQPSLCWWGVFFT